jgi:hypothetical protein
MPCVSAGARATNPGVAPALDAGSAAASGSAAMRLSVLKSSGPTKGVMPSTSVNRPCRRGVHCSGSCCSGAPAALHGPLSTRHSCGEVAFGTGSAPAAAAAAAKQSGVAARLMGALRAVRRLPPSCSGPPGEAASAGGSAGPPHASKLGSERCGRGRTMPGGGSGERAAPCLAAPWLLPQGLQVPAPLGLGAEAKGEASGARVAASRALQSEAGQSAEGSGARPAWRRGAKREAGWLG